MPDLMEYPPGPGRRPTGRPASPRPDSPAPAGLERWRGRAASWLRSAAERLGPGGRRRARRRAVRRARGDGPRARGGPGRAGPPGLRRSPGPPGSSCSATGTAGPPGGSPAGRRPSRPSRPPRPGRAPGGRSPGRSPGRPGSRPAPLTLQLPLKAGDSTFGTLRLTAPGRRPWPARVGPPARAPSAPSPPPPSGPWPARPGASPSPGFDPELGPAGLDDPRRLPGLRPGPGPAEARAALAPGGGGRPPRLDPRAARRRARRGGRRAGRPGDQGRPIRASDVVARLEDGRLAVLLPNASAENALKVAEAVRSAIARAGAASTTMPTLTASIGVATYPDHAHDVATLRAAASSTLTRAREQGHDRIAVAPSRSPPIAVARPGPSRGLRAYPLAIGNLGYR